MMQDIVNNNVLIAEFMGRELHTDGISWFDEKFKPIKYDDWNKLMPVVEKIESLDFVNDVLIRYCVLTNNVSFYKVQIGRDDESNPHPNTFPIEVVEFITDGSKEKTKMQVIYKACLEFINWYNENK